MHKSLISSLHRYQIGYTLYIGIVCSILTGIAHPLAATWSSKVLELIVNEQKRTDLDGEINGLCASFIVLGVAVMVFSGCGRTCWLLLSECWCQKVRLLLLENIIAIPQLNNSNAALSRIELINNVSGLGSTGTLFISSLLHTASSCITSLVVCFIHSAKLTLVVLSMIPLMILVTIGFEKVARSFERQRWTASMFASSLTVNALRHVTTLRQLAFHENYFILIERAQKAFVKSHNRWCHFPAARTGVVELLTCGIFIIGFWYGSILIRDANVTPTGSSPAIKDIIVVLYNCLYLLISLQNLQPTLTWFELNYSQLSQLDLQCHYAYQRRQRQLSGAPSKLISATTVAPEQQQKLPIFLPSRPLGSFITTPSSSEVLGQSSNHIELQNVTFGYASQPPVLCDLNLAIPRGKITLIHGPIGSGKSTLLKLMTGDLSPLQGRILMGGCDVTSNMDHETTASQYIGTSIPSLGVVDFEPLFFEDTIFRNISFGRLDFWNVTLNQVILICQSVGIHDIIDKWPLKYATVLHRNSLLLSTSQRKQLAIARAFIQNPDILFMDEPTSSVDNSLNKILFESIDSTRKGKTTVIISHRLNDVINITDSNIIDMNQLMNQSINVPSTRDTKDIKEEIIDMDLQDDGGLHKEEHIQRKSMRQSILSLVDDIYSEKALLGDTLQNMSQLAGVDGNNKQQYTVMTRLPTQVSVAIPPPVSTKSRRTSSTTTAQNPEMKPFPRYDSLQSQSRYLNSHPMSLLQETGSTTDRHFRWRGYIWEHKRLYNSVLILYGLCLIQGVLVPLYSCALSKLLASYPQILNNNIVSFRQALVPVIGFSAAKALLSWITQWYQRTSGKKCAALLQLDILRQLVVTTSSSTTINQESSKKKNAMPISVDDPLKQSACNHGRSSDDNNSLLWHHLKLVQKHPLVLDWLLTGCISKNLVAICVLFASMVVSLYECWKLTLVALSVALPIHAMATAIKKVGGSKYHLIYKDSQNETDKLIDEITHMKNTIRMLGLQSYFIRNAQLSFQLSMDLAKRGIPYIAISYGFVECTVYFTKAILFWYGTRLVRWMEFDSQAIVVVWILMLFMGSCHGQVLSAISNWPQIKSQFATMKTILAQGQSLSNQSSKADDSGDDDIGGMTAPYKTSVCAAELFGVNLQFDGIKVLSNVSIRIPHGKWIGLMGKSGCGKTMTLQALLYMHGRQQSGQILVDDQPLVTSMLSKKDQEQRLVRWRQKFGLVNQDPRFFPISIHANVALGSISFDVSRAQVEHACQLANIHDHIITLPNGYDTIMEEDGSSFSSGQQQLLALARALIRDPKLLLLDDITSALDGNGIRLVHETLKQLIAKGLSILMVSHNSQLLESTDQVYEMDKGMVVKKGRYDYLKTSL